MPSALNQVRLDAPAPSLNRRLQSADFSWIRNTDRRRVSIDRLVSNY